MKVKCIHCNDKKGYSTKFSGTWISCAYCTDNGLIYLTKDIENAEIEKKDKKNA